MLFTVTSFICLFNLAQSREGAGGRQKIQGCSGMLVVWFGGECTFSRDYEIFQVLQKKNLHQSSFIYFFTYKHGFFPPCLPPLFPK